MVFVMYTFGFNFPIFISSMSVGVFHTDSKQYGLSTSMMAIGTVTGALLAARRARPREIDLLAAATAFGFALAMAALAPHYWLFAVALVLTGLSAQIFLTSANSLLQLSTEPDMRGHVLTAVFAIAVSGAPIGAPVVALVADWCGPRWALGVGALAGFVAAAVAAWYLVGRGGPLADRTRPCHASNVPGPTAD
jgi:MFS family permease